VEGIEQRILCCRSGQFTGFPMGVLSAPITDWITIQGAFKEFYCYFALQGLLAERDTHGIPTSVQGPSRGK
jgi:hypothetical protein